MSGGTSATTWSGRTLRRTPFGAAIVLALVAAFADGAAKPRPARPAPFTIVTRGDTAAVRLSPALARALRQRFPQHRLTTPEQEDPQLAVLCRERYPGTRVSYAALGDFNGDGLPDAALHLRRPKSREGGLLAAFHATNSGAYRGYVVEARPPYGPHFCVARAGPGRIEYLRFHGEEPLARPGVLELRHDAIRFWVPAGAERLYYWDGKRYRFVETGE